MSKFVRVAWFIFVVFALTACQSPDQVGNNASALPSPTLTPTPVLYARFPDPADYTWTLVADEFQHPLFATHAGDGSGRLFVVGQDGQIWVMQNGRVLNKLFLDIDAKIASDGEEQGLLGLAFHPDYEKNGYFYIHYTDNGDDIVVARYQVSSDPNIADADSEHALLNINKKSPVHNGGNLEFGPDGFLYISLGDGGPQKDPEKRGQSLETLFGKILRVVVDAGDPYTIPADNPFSAGGSLPEIWAYGLRNPWRFSFDRATGDLYIGDVGYKNWEEIDYLPAGSSGGTNFGWRFFEGNHRVFGKPPEGFEFTHPVAEYPHESRCAVVGGYVYRGVALPAWQGVYFYGDYCSGEIFGLVQKADGSWEFRLLYDTEFLITSFGQDEAGEMYVTDRNGGLYQLQEK